MSAELEQVTLAVAAINKVETGLAALRETYGGVVYDVKTSEGMEAARIARRTIREPRFEVERIRKAAKAPILALGKQLDAEAARITRELTLIEAPIDQVIVAEELRKEQEKEARVAAEMARVAQIQKFIEGIRGWSIDAVGKPSSLVGQMVQTATDYVIDPAVFEERTDEAKSALMASLTALQGIHTAALDAERKAQQLKRDQEDLARLRAAEEQRQVEARAEQAKIDAAAKVEREAAAARAEAANKVERERIAKEAADAKVKRDAEAAAQAAIDKNNRERNEMALQEIQAIHHQLIIADMGRRPYCNGGDLATIDWTIDGTEKWELTEERFGALYAAAIKTKETTLAALRQKRVDFLARQETDAEAQRQAARAAELEAREAALKPKPEPAKVRTVERPTAAQIVAVIAGHYGVSLEMAAKWIRHAKVEMEQAA